MGMATGTDKAQDAEVMVERGAVHEINQGAAIVGMDLAGAFQPTKRACLEFWTKSGHKRIEQGFR